MPAPRYLVPLCFSVGRTHTHFHSFNPALRIRCYVFDIAIELLFAADDVIKVFGLPKLPRAIQYLIGFFSGERFPRMQDLLERPVGQGPEHAMDVVRHHAPGELKIALAFEELESASYHARNPRNSQVASPRP
jgi:hypothetical protein